MKPFEFIRKHWLPDFSEPGEVFIWLVYMVGCMVVLSFGISCLAGAIWLLNKALGQ